jgi:hypothetical protein
VFSAQALPQKFRIIPFKVQISLAAKHVYIVFFKNFELEVGAMPESHNFFYENILQLPNTAVY